MAEIIFDDFSLKVKEALKEHASEFLEEAAIIVEGETKRKTPTDKPQLKGSWAYEVDETNHIATVGSPLENSFWNEFGTGAYAENGKGRKGWWVYIKDKPRGARNSKVYANEEEASKAAAYLRSKGLPAVATNGEKPNHTLQNAFAAKKASIIRHAEEIMKGLGE